MDNSGNTRMHMTKSSMPMMAIKLELKQLSENASGLNSKFRWTGKMMGFTMDFTVVVSKWIKDKHKVLRVMGGNIFTTGLLIICVAQTTFRTRKQGAFIIVVIAGITSIGSMTFVNFILQSDFKFVLLAFTVTWIIALMLFHLHK
ncbi:MAG: hypothetical protein LH473_03805 [Chitinophagales bacterium]|nr:hypothetical protein [Chitinophagales bacterium]